MERWGAGIVRHRRWVAAAWLVIVVVAGYLNGIDKKSVSNRFRNAHADSQDAYDILNERFGSQNAATASVDFTVPRGQQLADSANAATVASVMQAIGKVKGVTSAPDPLTQNLEATI